MITRFARPAILPILLLMPVHLSACAATPERPVWFDSIHRLPLKTVLVEGNRIAYVDRGEGPAVILLHGFGGAMWQWEYQQATLAARYRVIALDLLGSGWSDKPDIEYTPTQLVKSLRGVMDGLGIHRAALIGNSMGAGVAIGMALSYPERVDRLVLVAGLPDHIRNKLTSPLVKRAVESRAPVWLVSLGNWLAGRGLTVTVLSEMVHDAGLLTPAVIERSYRNRKCPGMIPPLLALTRNLPLWEDGFARRLHEITQPTLVLWGAEDRVFPPQVGRDLAKVIPRSSFVLIPEAGHLPQWERPEVVNPILIDFLQASQA